MYCVRSPGWPGASPSCPASRVCSTGFWDFGVIVTSIWEPQLGLRLHLILSLVGVEGSLANRGQAGTLGARRRQEGTGLQIQAGMVKTGPGSSPGGHRQPRVRGQGPVPTGPGSGRWETHQAGHLGSEDSSGGSGGKGAGLRRACSRAGRSAHAHTCTGAGSPPPAWPRLL